MPEIYELTASDLLRLIKKNELSPPKVFQHLKERIEKTEPKVRAWAHLDFSSTEKISKQFASVDCKKKLHGIPVGIKDVLNTADFHTEMGSPIWKGFTPGNDARVVSDLKYENGYVMGKTQTSEFAVHALTETRNPHDLKRVPGTSSSGSAAAVAAGMVPVSLGTQTGGSVIRPASYCGIFGYKPSFGLVPRTGVLKTTDTLDTIGWFARSIEDISLIFEIVRVKGLDYPYVDRNVKASKFGKTLKVGLFKGPKWKFASREAADQILKFADNLEKSGRFLVTEFEMPEHDEIMESHETIYCKALSYYFKSEVRNSRTDITSVLSGMLDKGDLISPAKYLEEIERQAAISASFDKKLDVDVIIGLTAAGEAPLLMDSDIPDSCWPWTYLGMPVINLPIFSGRNGLPVGLQLTSRKYSDYKVLKTADMLWKMSGGKIRIPKLN